MLRVYTRADSGTVSGQVAVTAIPFFKPPFQRCSRTVKLHLNHPHRIPWEWDVILSTQPYARLAACTILRKSHRPSAGFDQSRMAVATTSRRIIEAMQLELVIGQVVG
jgi:hypothetical protein